MVELLFCVSSVQSFSSVVNLSKIFSWFSCSVVIMSTSLATFDCISVGNRKMST